MWTRQERGRVLVVEDEDGIQKLLGLLVERGGAEPLLAGTAAEARRLAATGIDAAVIDKNLPDGNGVDLLRWLRQEAPDVPVLLVTGYASSDSALEALRLGTFDYVLKPFDVAWVTRRIQLALEHRRLRRLERLVDPGLSDDEATAALLGLRRP